MRNKIFTLLTVFLIAISIASPALAEIKNWNNNQSNATTATGFSGGDICTQLFKGDPNNIFKEVFRSLINIVSLSIADFSTDLTCKIQETSFKSNYNEGAIFNLEDNGQCDSTSSTLSLPSSLTSSILTDPILSEFKIVRGIMTALAIAFFIFLAFANILHININTYSIKRALPMLFIALAGGFVSLYIVFVLSSVADFLLRLEMLSPQQTLHPMFNIFGGYLGNPFGSDIISSSTIGPANSVNLVFQVGNILTSGTNPTFISGLIGSILLVIPAVVVFVFEYILALRPFVVQILTVISPIAFVTLILPQTQFIFKKWWSIILIAIFYAPIVNLFFYLINLFPVDNTISPIAVMTLWAVKIVVIIFLIRLPFTFGSDLKKIGVRLAQTGLGNSIGLNRIIKSRPQDIRVGLGGFESDKKLKSAEAQRVIISSKAPTGPVQTGRITRPSLITPLITNIKDILREAHNANLKRTPDLLVRSASDIPTDTFKTITQNSDLKVFKDRVILDQLKNQNGQVLNEAGAALRADSSRKLVRLAEVIDNGRLTNPQTIKFLSQKRVLDQLPLYILKKALDEGVINTNDIQNTFGDNSRAVINRLSQMPPVSESAVNGKNISKIIDYDQKDFASGYKDLSLIMKEVLTNPDIRSASAGLTKNIIGKMKNLDKNAIDQNGLYYLERLGQIIRQSQQEISQLLQREGITNQTASAIALNPSANLANLNQFLNGKQVSDNTKQTLERNFLSRDLSTSLSSQIASSLSEEKTLIQKSIAGKISENVGRGKDLKTIKGDVATAMGKIASPTSPEQAQENIDKVNQYYPGAQIKTGQELTGSDLDKTKGRGMNILETIESMEKSGIDENTIKNNLPAVEKKVEGQVKDTIKKVASGAIASDSAFSTGLSNISAPTQK